MEPEQRLARDRRLAMGCSSGRPPLPGQAAEERRGPHRPRRCWPSTGTQCGARRRRPKSRDSRAATADARTCSRLRPKKYGKKLVERLQSTPRSPASTRSARRRPALRPVNSSSQQRTKKKVRAAVVAEERVPFATSPDEERAAVASARLEARYAAERLHRERTRRAEEAVEVERAPRRSTRRPGPKGDALPNSREDLPRRDGARSDAGAAADGVD